MIAARYFCCAAASTRYAAKRESRNMSDINGSKPTNFPLDESKLDFKIPRTDAPRENVLKLGSMITNRIGLKATADDPEYWGLAGVMTDEMVDVALKMGVRKPKTTEQLMKLTKMEREPLEKLLTEMAWTGIIEYNWENLDGKNPKHEKRWVLPLFVPGSAEFLNMRKSQIDEHPEVAAFFERMTMLPLEKITPMVPPGGAGIGMHVIPVEKAIETENESVDLEHISYWLSKYEANRFYDLVHILGANAKRNRIYIAETLEQCTFALHDRHAGFRSDVAQSENGGAVGDDCDQITAACQVITFGNIFLNFQTRLCNAEIGRAHV